MMIKERQKYDREFKQKAVELYFARGNAREIADELGIRAELLYRWRREYQKYENNSFPGKWKPKMTDLEKENARLRKELRDAKMERDILKKAVSIFSKSDETYGSPRITKELRVNGWAVSKNQVARIMRGAELRARMPKRFNVTSDSKYNYPVAPNLLDQEFYANRPGEVWVSDITYVRTRSGWLYLTVIIDLYDLKVIGWSMSKGLSAQETVIPAWRMAVRNRSITQKLIFHSDRGIQYACNAFTRILKANGLVIQSMSRKGNCWDNAVAESFFKTIKMEWIYRHTFTNQEQAQLSIFEWIESWYNRRRRHSALGYQTIEEPERSGARRSQSERNNCNFRNAA